jgi:hypothetical protein
LGTTKTKLVCGPGLSRYPFQQSQVGLPLDRIGIDIVGPCPVTENGNEFIIVVSDYFTKWCEAYAGVTQY